MPVPCPLPIDNGQNNHYEIESLVHPVDASDFSEAESEVVTKTIHTNTHALDDLSN